MLGAGVVVHIRSANGAIVSKPWPPQGTATAVTVKEIRARRALCTIRLIYSIGIIG